MIDIFPFIQLLNPNIEIRNKSKTCPESIRLRSVLRLIQGKLRRKIQMFNFSKLIARLSF